MNRDLKVKYNALGGNRTPSSTLEGLCVTTTPLTLFPSYLNRTGDNLISINHYSQMLYQLS